MKSLFNIRTMAEVAIFAAIGFVLDAIAGAYSAPLFINGGSIGIAMICVLIVSFRRGTLAGILTGLVMGLLDLADGFYAIASTWYIAMAQVLFDYVIVYAVVGFAGLFRKLSIKENQPKIQIGWLLIGCILGGVLKFSSHYLSGVLFWNDPSGFVWGFTNGFLYSLVYNGAYMFPSIVLVSLLMFLIAKKWPFILRDVNYAFLQKREEKEKE